MFLCKFFQRFQTFSVFASEAKQSAYLTHRMLRPKTSRAHRPDTCTSASAGVSFGNDILGLEMEQFSKMQLPYTPQGRIIVFDLVKGENLWFNVPVAGFCAQRSNQYLMKG
jgi:hypothetical protein